MHEKAKFVCFNYMQPQKVKFKSVQINMKHVLYINQCEDSDSTYGLVAGEHMCATGGKYYTEADRCDGRFDCVDQSDERDCPSKCIFSSPD